MMHTNVFPGRTPRMRGALIAAVCGLLALGGVAACGGKGSQAEQDAEKAKSSKQKDRYNPNTVAEGRKREKSLRSNNLNVQTFDLNRDKETDQWVYNTPKGKTLRIERDMNFDGDVDVWQYPTSSGEVVEEEMDLDMDGTVDVVAYYKNGTVRRKEMAVNFKRDYAITKFYNEKGSLLRVERDEDGDGTVDVWEYYDGEGNRERIGWDENSDGVPDTFDKLP